ncbi:N-acetylglucosamine-6-phosphate deacetylase [Paraliobacillus ryukyuensis]|uniref:N-acetylglucosamine-6-phosphate deacetylase n=1 Tax=Paraliobacillus ryukyuensis TaxID=200904 RepID=A0A366EC28_9BACI|nr:N-acetylglucosamine-6-phosphate deacetylase [Paraliobacillus ryukyuensis]RBO99882.1 N-acetylglucosamine-6-phosphate deacetylase [Paraliobacillus ryukyuensis]
MQQLILKNAIIYSDTEVIKNGYIKVKETQISKVGTVDELDEVVEPNIKVIDLSDAHKVIPGMIDIHIHGVNGADTMDATNDALETMATALPKEGTTSFLATTMTQSTTAIEAALANVAEYHTHGPRDRQAEIIGIHLEGPFVNPKRAGAQPVQHMLEPNVELMQHWQRIAKNMIRLVTLAPEQKGAEVLIQYLKQQGIIASMGHTDATFEQAEAAIATGVSHVTHLYNQMRGFHHREPGVVGAALVKDELMVELIADGIHSTKEAVQLALRQKTAERLVLITDAIRAKCLKNGAYDLGGQQVTVNDRKATLADGTLAGSTLKMNNAFQNILAFTNCSIEEAVKMTASNPAQELGLFNRKGSLTTGKDADMVVLNDANEVVMTICRGEIAYEKGRNG